MTDPAEPATEPTEPTEPVASEPAEPAAEPAAEPVATVPPTVEPPAAPEPEASAAEPVPEKQRRQRYVPRLAMLVAGLIVFVAVYGFLHGRSGAEHVDWHSARGKIGDHVAAIKDGDTTYNVRLTVPLWYDKKGKKYENSWPSCLKPLGRPVIRFATVTAKTDDTTFHPVVAIDCRGSS